MKGPQYAYLHVNGEMIFKNPRIVESSGGPEMYFEGPFVVMYWYIDSREAYRELAKELPDYIQDVENPDRLIDFINGLNEIIASNGSPSFEF